MFKKQELMSEDAYLRERKLTDTMRKDINDLRNVIYDLCGSKESGLVKIDDWYKKMNNIRKESNHE